MMNAKKFFVKSFVLLSAMSALLTTGISAYAKDVATEFTASDFYNYTTTRNGSHSNIDCEKNGTTLDSWSGYEGSYKWVRFSILGESNGSYYSIKATENTGYSSSLSTEYMSVDSEVARKVYKAKLYGTSNETSTVVDNYNIKVNKY